MKLVNKETGLRISTEQSLIDMLVLYGRNQYPKEFGGVLVGYYSDDKRTVNIIDSILPIDFKSTKTSFERGVEGLKEPLEEYYKQNPSLVYIGEWHTHPNAAPVPSCTDYYAMREIVDASSVCIDNPVMIIIGLTENSEKLAFYVYMENTFYKYEVI
ncbi:Mov34/MPN/PAD-1 family protein [Sphingobacterium sp. 2149]|uniref:Mov34/MPN/PAD-1 family protein n=1 Tax=Sphingobacterium sp. 2149 TaxID=2817763 RepID=UPI0028582CB6|nr:Mov34/MPN/PAD-1 family protein [Sphingobacterium sp. 2149]MDR6735206.1 integrative and conjugative element protein (TIGR02256 family) [Sphingobacterium sp. 2149]